jgi:hypothetical protein
LGLSITASMPFSAKPAKDSLSVLFNIDDSNNYKMHFFLCFGNISILSIFNKINIFYLIFSNLFFCFILIHVIKQYECGFQPCGFCFQSPDLFCFSCTILFKKYKKYHFLEKSILAILHDWIYDNYHDLWSN